MSTYAAFQIKFTFATTLFINEIYGYYPIHVHEDKSLKYISLKKLLKEKIKKITSPVQKK